MRSKDIMLIAGTLAIALFFKPPQDQVSTSLKTPLLNISGSLSNIGGSERTITALLSPSVSSQPLIIFTKSDSRVSILEKNRLADLGYVETATKGFSALNDIPQLNRLLGTNYTAKTINPFDYQNIFVHELVRRSI